MIRKYRIQLNLFVAVSAVGRAQRAGVRLVGVRTEQTRRKQKVVVLMELHM
jgi:hypothetical protein